MNLPKSKKLLDKAENTRDGILILKKLAIALKL